MTFLQKKKSVATLTKKATSVRTLAETEKIFQKKPEAAQKKTSLPRLSKLVVKTAHFDVVVDYVVHTVD